MVVVRARGTPRDSNSKLPLSLETKSTMALTSTPASSIALLMLLPGAAVGQMVVVREVGDLHAGGQQLILRSAPLHAVGQQLILSKAPSAVRIGGKGPPLLARLRQAPAAAAAAMVGGRRVAIRGIVSGEPLLRGSLDVRPGIVFERSQESKWMPKGDGVVQRQEAASEEVSSDGLRQVRLVSCENARCETTIQTEHALLPAAAPQVSTQHNWAANAAGELLGAPDPELVAKEKLEQMEESVDEQAEDEDYTKDGDADDNTQEYLDGLRKGTSKLHGSTASGERDSDPADDDTESEMEFDIDESNPVKSMMQIMHARDTVEAAAQQDVAKRLVARAEAFRKRLGERALVHVAERRAVEGQLINTINEEIHASQEPSEKTPAKLV